MSCPDCFKGLAHTHAEPKGKEETLRGILTFVAGGGSTAAAVSAKPTILFITDAFRFSIPNGRLLADEYAAKTGFRILVPDTLPGGGVPAYSLDLFEAAGAPVAWWNLFSLLKKAWTSVRYMSLFIPFILRTRNAFDGMLAYTSAVKADLPASSKLGAPSVEGGSDPLVDVLTAAHPAGPRKPGEFAKVVRSIHVPTSVAIGDKDMIFAQNSINELEAVSRREYEESLEKLEFTVYPNCGHGSAVRVNPREEVESKAAELASEQAVA